MSTASHRLLSTGARSLRCTSRRTARSPIYASQCRSQPGPLATRTCRGFATIRDVNPSDIRDKPRESWRDSELENLLSSVATSPSRGAKQDPMARDARDYRSYPPALLRDMCSCPKCVDSSTRQKLFTTTDIPDDIRVKDMINQDQNSISLTWVNDIPGFDTEHTTRIGLSTLEAFAVSGKSETLQELPDRVLWDRPAFEQQVPDISYEAYMSNDTTLYSALTKLQTHGLLFLTNVPDTETSVSTIASRIGPLKNTFYGNTWDVRSIPEAKNVAYTAQDLGFHMDLLYMEQPPHLQLLHCIRSSSAGGASLFTDSYRAVADLLRTNGLQDFFLLAGFPINFHYNHLESHYYHQSRNVVEMLPGLDPTELDQGRRDPPIDDFIKAIDAVSWSPPFQAPFRSPAPLEDDVVRLNAGMQSPMENFRDRFSEWLRVAKAFNAFVHQESGIYERMMKPGECVIFDNRRVLHARRAFEVGDMGKERWLRGAYVDKDPYLSKLRVLQHRFDRQK